MLICRLNKTVASAALVDAGGEKVELSPPPDEPLAYQVTLPLTASRRFELRLVDDAGRANKTPPVIVLEALPNLPPEVKLTAPARDLRVSPLEEVSLQGNAWDDFGLRGFGVSYSIAGAKPKTITLGNSAPGKTPTDFARQLALESLSAQPDQLVSYYGWAEDIGPDGQPRRTSATCILPRCVTLKRFFRQGEQPPGGDSQQQRQQQQQQQGGAGGNAQQAEKLAELQKQIIAATWKLIRRETGPKASEKFADDVEVVRQSQESAAEQLAALVEKLTDPASKDHAEAVGQHMTAALEALSNAGKQSETAALQPALSAEQAAYQALLKLRPRT